MQETFTGYPPHPSSSIFAINLEEKGQYKELSQDIPLILELRAPPPGKKTFYSQYGMRPGFGTSVLFRSMIVGKRR
jgi:hypothetical protein